ncbi:AraC family transcriptional regulator [Paenibacillus sp. H1-7]|uniref:helix-turn-helix domain-containing protein n=1 Tax=Paenibacillus sp. H1-7 TaxID=2282849 RepID=UPI001EF99429|nr:AraC family transcriptional regulator [Paenibacillus sp. H1-7]ULL13123.1 AraC family transcriptional regulator [Paenibacillus sp. H1-7]
MSLQWIELPAEGMLMYEFQHVDGDVVKPHHHQVHQILYALEGQGKITLNGKSSEYSQDRVAVIVPNSEHAIVSDSRLTVLVLAFDERIFDTPMRQELLHPYFGMSQLGKPNPLTGGELRQLLRKMLYEQSSAGKLGAIAMKIILSELLIVLARSLHMQQATDANSLRAERIRHYIDTHYFEIVNAGDIAAKQGISLRYINNIFKEQYSLTPMQYLTDIRIGMAKQMLAETDKDIASICFELGFETVSTFYRIFKDAVQMPPNKYRTLHKMQEPGRSG